MRKVDALVRNAAKASTIIKELTAEFVSSMSEVGDTMSHDLEDMIEGYMLSMLKVSDSMAYGRTYNSSHTKAN